MGLTKLAIAFGAGSLITWAYTKYQLVDKLHDDIEQIPFKHTPNDDVSVLVSQPAQEGFIHRLGFPVQPRGGPHAISGYLSAVQQSLSKEIIVNLGSSIASLIAFKNLLEVPSRFSVLGVTGLLIGSSILNMSTLQKYTEAAAAKQELQKNEVLYRNFGPYVYQKNVDEKKKNRGGSRTMIMSTMWLLWLFSHPAMTVAVSCFTFSGIKLGYFERYGHR